MEKEQNKIDSNSFFNNKNEINELHKKIEKMNVQLNNLGKQNRELSTQLDNVLDKISNDNNIRQVQHTKKLNYISIAVFIILLTLLMGA